MFHPKVFLAKWKERKNAVKPAFPLIPKKLVTPLISLDELEDFVEENRVLVGSCLAVCFGGLLLVGTSYIRDSHAMQYQAPNAVSASTMPDSQHPNVVRSRGSDDNPFVDVAALAQKEGEDKDSPLAGKPTKANRVVVPAIPASSRSAAGSAPQRSVYFTPPIPMTPPNHYAQQAPVQAPATAPEKAQAAAPKAEPAAPEKKGWQDSRIAFFGGDNPSFGQLSTGEQ